MNSDNDVNQKFEESLADSQDFVPSDEAVEGDSSVWEEPLPIKAELLPVQPFDLMLMPDPLRPFVQDCSFRMQCPPDYIAAPMIAMIGSLIGTACRIKPKQYDDWKITANLWGGIIGAPSKLKTPALELAFLPVKEIEKKATGQYEDELKKWNIENEINKLNEENVRSKIKKELKDSTIDKQKAQEILASEIEDNPKPSCKRYRTDDGTIEKIHELLSTNPRGLMIRRDELVGLMSGWEKDGHESDRAFYLESWNGNGSYTVDRIGRGTIYVENLCLSVFGTTQPDKIAAYIRRSSDALENDGLVQRFQLMVYPDPPENWQYVDQAPDHKAKQDYHQIAATIADPDFFKNLFGEDQTEENFLHFDAEAQQIFIACLTELETKLRLFEEPIIEQHLAKYRKLMPALALIFHVIDIANGNTQSKDITKASALRATAWCLYLESHARRIYDMALNVSTQAASVLSKRIEQGKLDPIFTIRDIARKRWSIIGNDTELAKSACEELIKAGWIREKITPPTKTSRGKTEYVINPRIKISKVEETADEQMA